VNPISDRRGEAGGGEVVISADPDVGDPVGADESYFTVAGKMNWDPVWGPCLEE
jgi:hypothetical protein